MRILLLFVFVFGFQAQGSELIYGTRGQDYHDIGAINFDTNILRLPSSYVVLGKSQKKMALGEFKFSTDKTIIKLYKLLPVAFKKSTAFKGAYPSHQPYFKYRDRIITSNSIFFKPLSKLFQKVIKQKGKQKTGIQIESQGKSFKITQVKKYIKSTPAVALRTSFVGSWLQQK